eukprot:7215967-Prymnesium_polylepis.1
MGTAVAAVATAAPGGDPYAGMSWIEKKKAQALAKAAELQEQAKAKLEEAQELAKAKLQESRGE